MLGLKCQKTGLYEVFKQYLPLSLCPEEKPHILQTCAYNTARGESSVFQASNSASLDF